MRLLALTRYGRLGSSSRLRFYQYVPYLRQNGIEVAVAPLLSDEYLQLLYAGARLPLLEIAAAYFRRLRQLFASNRFDLLWIEKELFPWLPSWFEAALHHLSTPYVVDYDDAVFHRYDLNASPFVRALLSTKIDGVMRHSAVVIAGNRYLGNRAAQAGARQVEYLPTVIDLNHYPDAQSRSNDSFTIGWIGSPSTTQYLNAIGPALKALHSEGRTRVVLIGSSGFHLEGVPVDARTWTERTEATDISEFDVGIMPLADGPWERGKCGYKLIQYMACALPVIASPVGVNEEIVETGRNGFLASTTREWTQALQALKEDRTMRLEMGSAGRAKVEELYCTSATAPRLLSILIQAARKNTGAR